MSNDWWLVDGDGRRVGEDVDCRVCDDARPLYPVRAAHEASAHAWNLTRNVSPLLWAAGWPEWREVIGMSAEAAGALTLATLTRLRAEPERFRELEPDNGWGNYEGAVAVLESFLVACSRHPRAEIGGWL